MTMRLLSISIFSLGMTFFLFSHSKKSNQQAKIVLDSGVKNLHQKLDVSRSHSATVRKPSSSNSPNLSSTNSPASKTKPVIKPIKKKSGEKLSARASEKLSKIFGPENIEILSEVNSLGLDIKKVRVAGKRLNFPESKDLQGTKDIEIFTINDDEIIKVNQLYVGANAGSNSEIIRSQIDNLFNSDEKYNIDYIAIDTFVMELESNDFETLEQMRSKISNLSGVTYAEYMPIPLLSGITNDTYINDQWGLENEGTLDSSSVVDIDLDIETSWNFGSDCRGVRVMVADSGIDVDHEDLIANLSSLRYNAMVGVDSLFPGYFTDESDIDDFNGHGTHVAGTIGAVGNNAKGVSGVCQKAEIVGAKVGYSFGFIEDAAVVKSVDYAIANNVKVINLSLGGSGISTAFKNAADRAKAAGVIIVAAAGNSNSNNDSSPHYPSNLTTTHSNVIAVAALASNGQLASFSNYGSNTVDVAAPGHKILSTFPNQPVAIDTYTDPYGQSRYFFLSGTSMAAPHVAGVITLFLKKYPNFNPLSVKARLLNQHEPYAGVQNIKRSGFVNASYILNENHRSTCGRIPNAALTDHQYVTDLYCRLLNRVPDQNGLNNWVNKLTNQSRTRKQVFEGFVQSQEFRNIHSSLPGEESVSIAYDRFLNRKPDSVGYSNFLGTSLLQTYTGVSYSPEFSQKYPYYFD